MTSETLPSLSVRRAALAVLVLALAPAIGQGIARFAYALVLPDMQADLRWSYAEAGWMNTMNAAGYLGGALIASSVIRRMGAWRALWVFCLVGSASIALSGASGNFVFLSGVRLIAGITAAIAFIAGATLGATLASRSDRSQAFLIALYYMGPGLGIVLSGLSAPLVLAELGPGGWRGTWYFLGALSLVLCVGLLFAGPGREEAPRAEGGSGRVALAPMAPILIGYTLFGVGYIAYMTFMIAWVQENGGGPLTQGAFWAAIGCGGMIAPFLWARLFETFPSGRAAAFLIAITSLGSIGPLISVAPWALIVSALVFGSAFFAVVAATTIFIRRNYPPDAWAAGIGMMTIAFGLGQTLGPVGIGAITDIVGGLGSGLAVSALVLGLGAILCLFQRDRPAPV